MPTSDRDKWDARYRGRTGSAPPSVFVVTQSGQLPRGGRCLDVAGGSGRQGLCLADAGLDVTIADVSPEGLRLAREQADARGLVVRTLEWDFEEDGLPLGPWDVIVCVHFLHRPLLPKIADALAPGGFLIVEHPTRTNLERNAKPSERYLLENGELVGLIDHRLVVLHHEERWNDDGRHEARLVARRLA